MPQIELVLAIGRHAQNWHLGGSAGPLGETVARWQVIYAASSSPHVFPLPHPSWRNTGWLKRNPWFEDDLLHVLRARVRALIDAS